MVVVVVLVAMIVIVLVVNSISSSCSSSRILTWTSKYKSGVGARARKYKLGARAGKCKLGARAGKYKLGARAGKYKLGARARAGIQGQGPSKGPGAAKHKDPFQNSTLKKKTIIVTEIVLISCSLTVGSKQKIKIKTQNIMASSYRLKFSSTVPFLSCLDHEIQ